MIIIIILTVIIIITIIITFYFYRLRYIPTLLFQLGLQGVGPTDGCQIRLEIFEKLLLTEGLYGIVSC